jgi:NFU1 iron-sulfur cluster scaffold homolog, mitochondrial
MKKKNNKEIIDAIKKALDEVRPHLRMDGGDVQFESFDEKTGVLLVSLKGACAHCAMSQITLQSGVGAAVMESVPEVKKVLAV